VDDCWQHAATLACIAALWSRGEFDPGVVFDAIDKDPLGSLDNWLEDGLFDREPLLLDLAYSLYREWGIGWPLWEGPDGIEVIR
jgi:hypothetical protein